MDDLFHVYMEGQLKAALEEVEMPASYYEKARTSYGSLSRHLLREGSAIAGYRPEVFLQGSIRTGTAIKPTTDDGSYDVDAVCNLKGLGKSGITQKDLKALVGKEVESYARGNNMSNAPHDGKRCWTLEYVDEANFHIDILPSIDDLVPRSAAIEEAGFELPDNASFMAYTDKRHASYASICRDWPSTNPKGYASWFFKVAEFDSHRRRVAIAKARSANEIAPDEVKAPLQQYVQLLKRHRDVFFDKHDGLPPVRSIVITTLAARAYEGIKQKGGWYEDFANVVATMPTFIAVDGVDYSLRNPSDPLENFVGDWGKAEYEAFRLWHRAASSEIAPARGSLKKGVFNRSPRNDLRKALGIPERGGKLAKALSRDAEYVGALSHHREHGMTEIDAVAVTISATKTRSGGVPKPFESGEELPKRVSLRFTAHAENIRSFHVRWQVTNDGQEALRANCLRGDFYEGVTLKDGRRTRTESTSYTGRHYVECILERDGVVYGRSEPFVVSITDGASANLNW